MLICLRALLFTRPETRALCSLFSLPLPETPLLYLFVTPLFACFVLGAPLHLSPIFSGEIFVR